MTEDGPKHHELSPDSPEHAQEGGAQKPILSQLEENHLGTARTPEGHPYDTEAPFVDEKSERPQDVEKE